MNITKIDWIEPEELAGKIYYNGNYGDFVFASAPGIATLPANGGTDSAVFGGTSISSALMAGVIASYIAAHPTSTPEETIARLEQALSPFPPDQNPLRGKGLLDSNAIDRFLSASE